MRALADKMPKSALILVEVNLVHYSKTTNYSKFTSCWVIGHLLCQNTYLTLFSTIAEEKRSKSNNYCDVPQCKSYCSGNISLHHFPKSNKILRQKWIHALKIGKEVSPFMTVCSKHFTSEDFFFNRGEFNLSITVCITLICLFKTL